MPATATFNIDYIRLIGWLYKNECRSICTCTVDLHLPDKNMFLDLLALFFRIRTHNFVEGWEYFHELTDDACVSTPDNTDIVTH